MSQYIRRHCRLLPRDPALADSSSRISEAFTIIELLVVIVVIAILAAITLVAYSGISQKAVTSSLQSDLSNAATQVKMFQVENGVYPVTNNCPVPAATEICLKFSSGNTLLGYSADSQAKTFQVIANNGSLVYKVTNTTAPTQLVTTTQPGVTPGAAIELHAAKANAGTSQGINSPLTTTWADTSGSNMNVTLNNFGAQTPWAGAGIAGDPYRLAFDGVDDYVQFTTNANLAHTKLLTIEAWFRISGDCATYPTIASELGVGSSGVILYVLNAANGNRLAAALKDDSSPAVYAVGPTPVVNDGAWHHGMVVMDGVNAKTWADGVAGSSRVIPTGAMTTTGTRLSYGIRRWSGDIAVVRVYPFALSATQVAANYAAGPTW